MTDEMLDNAIREMSKVVALMKPDDGRELRYRLSLLQEERTRRDTEGRWESAG